MVTGYICPVCGYDDLDEQAYDGIPIIEDDAIGSLEICPSCGFQFGKTDDDEGITFEQWRERWIAGGMPWDGIGIHAPPNWNPREQLKNIGVVV